MDAPLCILCGCQTHPWLQVPMVVPSGDCDHYDLYRCPECGYGTVWPRPRWEEVALHYAQDSYYTHGNAAKEHPATPLSARLAWRGDKGKPVTAKRVLQLCNGPTRICELGCGGGLLLADLKAAGADVVGVEPDERSRLETCRRGVDVLPGTAEQLPEQLPCGSFDIVIMSHALEHCLDPAKALENVNKLLKPGGVALLTVPNHECLGQLKADITWRWLDLPRHVSFFNGRSLRKLCKHSGLVPESTDYGGYFRQFNHEWREEERRIREAFGMPQPPSPWPLLLRTFFAPDPLKYDSVCVTARKVGE